MFVVAVGGTRGCISGGFSEVPWAKTNRKGGYIHSEKAFLFALNPNPGPPVAAAANNSAPSQDNDPIKFDIVKKPYGICYHPE